MEYDWEDSILSREMVTLNYDILLEIASNLVDIQDIINFQSYYKEILETRDTFWQDLIHRKYNFTLEEATSNDYKFLTEYMALDTDDTCYIFHPDESKSEVKGEYIIEELMGKSHSPLTLIPELELHILPSLAKIEAETEGEYRFWSQNNNHYFWGEIEGLFVKAKTLDGAVYTLLGKVPEFRKLLFDLFVGYKHYLEGVYSSRLARVGVLRAKDILKRAISPPSYLPSEEILDSIYSSNEKKSLLDIETCIQDFLLFIEGETKWGTQPLLHSYRRLQLLQ